jgi:large subunit ribosomal protein L29
MGISKFNDIKTLSTLEISQEIIKTEKTLFDLRFKKATRQPFKSHEIKNAKRRLAQLKTILTARIDVVEETKSNTIDKLIDNAN